ncbi:Cof-type HAD-IIB family hydrolase [Ectobacillus panaciterrae]|uniref:Cof-type HAD-IIB family hydrolase n=1 Tax=Ectobacillus panaciterrae TaxID=363872 RepID=UPI000424D516|nr:Cof-type HAD-IIB family hydrolase [Ectobacillus panaciterrae]
MIKLFVSDLDDTLVYNVSEIHKHDMRALRWLAEQGTDICFSSGRFAHRIHDAVEGIGLAYHTSSLNGALLTTKEGATIHTSAFDGETAKEIYKYICEKELAHIACAGATRYTKKKNRMHHVFEEKNNVIITEMAVLEDEFGTNIHPAKFFLYGDHDSVAVLDQELKDVFGACAEVVISGPGFVDIMPLGISKGSALQILMEHLCLEPHQVACIGDSFNDISMFKVTPHSFTLHHAPPLVKENAQHVVRSVEEAVIKLASLS